MFGGISGLSFIQKCYLELAMLFTIVLPLAMLPLTDDALITTLSYQLCCLVVVPLVYIKYLSKEKEITPYFIDEFRNKSQQFMTGLTGMALAMIVLLASYLLYYEFSFSSILSAHIPVVYNPFYLTCLLVSLVFLNPLLEEWFWRVFLSKTLDENGRKLDIINLHYGIYHFYIIYYIVGIKSAFMFTMTYLSFGRSMQFMKEKYGYGSCVLTHLGLSLGMVLCFFDVIYNQEQGILSA